MDIEIINKNKKRNKFTSIELFAGCGGSALGLEKAGFNHILLNELDKDAVATMKHNRPEWNIMHDDIDHLSFKKYEHSIDLLSGGFPCQSFSYAGKKKGLKDKRGSLFFQFARAISEIKPKLFLAENVKGLLSNDNGKTLLSIKAVIDNLGYHLLTPTLLKAQYYNVPQKRERLFLVGIKKELYQHGVFAFPKPSDSPLTIKDALKKGILYDCDVPHSLGQHYPEHKKKILELIPQGGYWRDLPIHLQKEYMQKSYYSGGGKTGIARRLSWNEPCLTLTCSPAQKQTERCHPDETRPLTIREYARIQTFPDTWVFHGSISSQYKQIGNAVPVNLSYIMGLSLVKTLKIIN